MQMSETIQLPKSWPEKLETLKVNESLPVEDIDVHACRIAVSRIHKQSKKKKLFTTRRINETDKTRVWRIK